MAIVDDLTPRQCIVIGQILGNRLGLTRKQIADKTGKDEKTVERILKSIRKSVLRKKRDANMNGAPYRYRAILRKKSYNKFSEKFDEAMRADIVPGTVPGAHTSDEDRDK